MICVASSALQLGGPPAKTGQAHSKSGRAQPMWATESKNDSQGEFFENLVFLQWCSGDLELQSHVKETNFLQVRGS